jgi:hypothetical protein
VVSSKAIITLLTAGPQSNPSTTSLYSPVDLGYSFCAETEIENKMKLRNKKVLNFLMAAYYLRINACLNLR